MKNYEEAWKALENRERFIDSELRKPGLSAEKHLKRIKSQSLSVV